MKTITLSHPPSSSSSILPVNRRWLGAPKIERLSDGRLRVIAEASETECDRKVKLRKDSNGIPKLDFSVEICMYRQVPFEEFGYAFERVRRSESNANSFEIEIKDGRIGSYKDDVFRFKTSAMSLENVWSPAGRWLAAPVIAIDTETKRITITPSGERGWEYTHIWYYESMNSASLYILDPKHRLELSGSMSLGSPFWEFTPVVSDSNEPKVTILKDRWMQRESGSVVLSFFEVQGMLFNGETSIVYQGIPKISLEESGRLTVQSDGDTRFLFRATLVYLDEESVQVRFAPIGSAVLGSVDIQADENEEATCVICFDNLTADTAVVETKCKHKFHLDCLRRVEKRECPYCRGSFDLI